MRTGKREKESFGVLIFIITFLLGLIMGTVLIKMTSISEQSVLSEITSSFINTKTQQGFLDNLLSSFFSTSVFLLFAFFVGFFALGKPIAILIPMFKGLGLGISMADIFMQNGVKGYLICLILVLPSAIVSLIAIIFASKEAAKASSLIFSFVCRKINSESDDTRFGAYIIKFTAFFIIALLGAVIDATLTFFFSNMF